MIHNIPFKNTRSVTFNCVDFTAQVKRGSRLRHAIYGRNNVGLCVTPRGFTTGMGIGPLAFNLINPASGNTERLAARDFDILGERIRRGYCAVSDIPTVALWVRDRAIAMNVSHGWNFWINNQAEIRSHVAFASGVSNGKHLIFSGGSNGVWFSADDGRMFTQLLEDVSATSIVNVFQRLFVANGASISFSAAHDLTDFVSETSGELLVPSELGKVLSLHQLDNNRLLVVQEGGFSTLEVMHDPANFQLRELARSFQPVVPNTTQVFGDEVYYLAHGGMCRILRNGRVELLDTPVEYQPNYEGYSSAIFENRYYLTLSDRILVIERFFESFSFIGDVKAHYLFPVRSVEGESALAVLEDSFPTRIHQVTPSGHFKTSSFWGDEEARRLPQAWESEPFGLSYAANRQWLKQLLIKTNCNLRVTLTATSTGRVQTLDIQPDTELQQFNINLRGDMFTIKLETEDQDIQVSDLSAVVAFGR